MFGSDGWLHDSQDTHFLEKIKMKKSLAALAVLGAFAGSAFAADVTLYGLVDYGFNYQHVDSDEQDADAGDSFRMMSGQNSGSRFGLKGTEDLGNGLTVGFVLENGFNADDGTLGNGDRLFGRESQVYLQGAFGTLSFGRVGQLVSANGSYALFGNTSPFSSGWQDSVGQKFVTGTPWDRYDNTITYKTPSFAGFQVHAQYSFDTNSKAKSKMPEVEGEHGVEGSAKVDRYYAIGATYKAENLYLVGVVDSVNYGSYYYDNDKLDDAFAVTLGGNYNFGFMTVYAMGQYFENSAKIGQKSAYGASDTLGDGYNAAPYGGADGFGVALGLGVPCFGGTAKASVGYLSAETNEKVATGADKAELDRWNISVGYDYNLSKRTTVYTAAAYTKDSLDTGSKGEDVDPSSVEVMAGLIHRF